MPNNGRVGGPSARLGLGGKTAFLLSLAQRSKGQNSISLNDARDSASRTMGSSTLQAKKKRSRGLEATFGEKLKRSLGEKRVVRSESCESKRVVQDEARYEVDSG